MAFDLGKCTDEDIKLLREANQDYPPMKALLARMEAAETPCEKARQVLCDVAQLLDGWHSDVAWTDWDESVRKAVSDIQRDIAAWRKSCGK